MQGNQIDDADPDAKIASADSKLESDSANVILDHLDRGAQAFGNLRVGLAGKQSLDDGLLLAGETSRHGINRNRAKTSKNALVTYPVEGSGFMA